MLLGVSGPCLAGLFSFYSSKHFLCMCHAVFGHEEGKHLTLLRVSGPFLAAGFVLIYKKKMWPSLWNGAVIVHEEIQ